MSVSMNVILNVCDCVSVSVSVNMILNVCVCACVSECECECGFGCECQYECVLRDGGWMDGWMGLRNVQKIS